MQEYLEIFQRNFPFIVREEDSILHILKNENNRFIGKRDENGRLIGLSVVNQNTILLLCVDQEYRKQGIGTGLLAESESIIREAGFAEIVVGVGFSYLMPGVPTSRRYFDAVNEALDPSLDESASDFFTKRGYAHSRDCNIFDMRFPLEKFDQEVHSVGDTIDGITYRWAGPDDLPKICRCTDDALEEFTRWYKNEKLYAGNPLERVLVALDKEEVVGALIVGQESASKKIGSVGCTSVKHSSRGKHVAVNMVTLGTKYLRDIGMKEAFLSYTYSGLDRMYGYAGYKISVYYMMARKSLV